MDEAFFWRLVEEARAEVGADTERVAQALLRRLRTLRPDALERFQQLWEQVQDELNCWPVMDAATLLLGHIDDELAVQDWILSHGRETMRGVLNDPDSPHVLAILRPPHLSYDLAGPRGLRALSAASECVVAPVIHIGGCRGVEEDADVLNHLVGSPQRRRRVPTSTATRSWNCSARRRARSPGRLGGT